MQILGILLLALVGQDPPVQDLPVETPVETPVEAPVETPAVQDPDANADGYYKFDKGTTWTYDQQEEGDKGTIVLTIQGEEEGKIVVDSKESKGGEEQEAKDQTLLWYVEDGLLRWGEKDDNEMSPMFSIWKVGAAKGDTWVGMGGGEVPFSLTATHMGVTPLKTPYKEFEKAVHVQLSMAEAMEGMTMEINIYLVEGIGVVKFAGQMGGEEGFSMILREFKKS